MKEQNGNRRLAPIEAGPHKYERHKAAGQWRLWVIGAVVAVVGLYMIALNASLEKERTDPGWWDRYEQAERQDKIRAELRKEIQHEQDLEDMARQRRSR
jgi:hypothetical protein